MNIKQLLKMSFPNIYAKRYYKKLNHSGVKDIRSFLETEYFKRNKISLNLDNPQTFYDKINYLKLHYLNPEATVLVDKYAVKGIVAKAGYQEKCTKIIGFFNDTKTFKCFFKKNKKSTFVVKLSHTSGDVFFYNNGKWRDKHGRAISKNVVFSLCKYGLKFNYYNHSFEPPYKNVVPRIICEEYLPSMNNKGLDEYKFFCNYGEIKMANIVYGRQNKDDVYETFVDKDFNSLGVYQKGGLRELKDFYIPKCIDEMKRFAEKMSKPFPIVRVDLLTDGNDFYFCEFTFFDCGGNNVFYPLEKNKIIGDLFNIEKN